MKHLFRFYITFLFSIFILLFASCEAQTEDRKNPADSMQTYSGTIIKQNFVDKGGRVHQDIFDLYLNTDQGKIFIKISEGRVKRDEILNYLDKEIVVKAKLISWGLWDTDDPNVQSRVGDYFIFYEIIE